MLRLFFPARPSAPVRVRLGFEELGGRLAPSDLFGNDEPDQVLPPYAATANPPVIENFRVEESGYGFFILTGRVTGVSPDGTTVRFASGFEGLDGRVVEVNDDGEFYTTFTVPGNHGSSVSVTATDGQGNQSDEVFGDMSPTVPPGGGM